MVIGSVSVQHVRSHTASRVDCSGDVTILTGSNGSGKTSILEAVSLCSMGKTFVPVPDLSLIQRGSDCCSASVEAVSDNDVPYRVEVEVRSGMRKKINSNRDQNVSTKDLIGEMPVVALSPDHKAITLGGPSERRSFIDGMMAQSSRIVTGLLYEHRRVLKQRNVALQELAQSHKNGVDTSLADEQVQLWTKQFITLSAQMVEKRATFIEELKPLITEEYKAVSGDAEEIDVRYEPDHVLFSEGDLIPQFEKTAERLSTPERMRGSTLFGPQKDDICFMINGGLVRETASQGQHKSLLIALKLAECRLIMSRRNERPIVLLDDVFSELDQDRTKRVLDRILHLGMQSIVTATNAEAVIGDVDSGQGTDGSEIKIIEVRDGTIHSESVSMYRWGSVA